MKRILPAMLLVLALFALAPLAYANRGGGPFGGPFDFSGSWFIAYREFSNGTCTDSWDLYANSLMGIGGEGPSPVVSPGRSVCVTVKVSGSSDIGKTVWYEIDDGNSPYPSPVDLFTISSTGLGSGINSFIWSNAQFDSSVGSCGTVPEKLAIVTGSSIPTSADFDGHVADVFIQAGPNCPGGYLVPEFPAGTLVLLALSLPLIVMLRSRHFSLARSLYVVHSAITIRPSGMT